MSRLQSYIILFIASIIWGSAFVAQSAGMDYIGPWTFTCVRSIFACITIIILLPVIRRIAKQEKKPLDKTTVIAGICCGLALTPATLLQQIGIQYTTVGKAGFVTSLYCIFVPLFSIFLHKKVSKITWLSACIALVGFHFLCLSQSFTLSIGDAYVFGSAILFAVQILTIDHFVNKADGVMMSCIQFMVVSVLTFIPMMILEKPSITLINSAMTSILYAGVLSNGVGYTFQIIGQKNADPTTATLIMSLESVFSAIFGLLLLHQSMTLSEAFGCVLVFAGVILAQIGPKD